MRERLTGADWLDHGLATLAGDGPGGLRVGPMAARLKVSRGSFYWHFRDLADFRAQLLARWREHATDRVISDIAGTAEPDRLRHLLRRAFVAVPALDRAVRDWAARDAGVAAAVAEIDARRITYIAGLLEAAGVAADRAAQRAAFLYWAYLGQALVMAPGQAAIGAEALDEIAGLFES